MSFTCFLALLHWPGVPEQCWVEVVRAGILISSHLLKGKAFYFTYDFKSPLVCSSSHDVPSKLPLRTWCVLGPPPVSTEFFFFYLFFIYLFLAALGLHCCSRAFSSCGERGLLFVEVRRLLIAVASLVAEHRL